MARKKDLQGAISKGADMFFSANDAQETKEAYEAEQEQQAAIATEAIQPHKAQEESPEALAATIEAMQQAIETDAADKLAAAEARRTQGRKGYKMPRCMITLTPSGMEYVKIMSRINGMSATAFISALVDRDAAANAEIYQKAKELMSNAR